MTKRITTIFYIVMASLLFFACKKDLPTLDMSKVQINATTTATTDWTGFTKDDAPRPFINYTIAPVNVGVTAVTKYVIEMDTSDQFENPIVLSTFQNIYRDTTFAVNVQPIDSILQKNFKLTTGTPTANISLRIRINVLNQNNQPVGDTITSLLGKYTVGPIYKAFELLPYNLTTPNLWYLVGSMAAPPNDWKNDVAHLGSGLWPLSVVAGNNYDVQGNGLYEATFYFKAGTEFKIINKPGNWNPAFGSSSGNTTVTYFATEGGNIKIATDGWYKITLNSIENTCTITTTAVPTTSYTDMGMVGTINNWGSSPDISMTPIQTTNNHIWYTTYTFATGAEVKFRNGNAWGNDWGGNNFPISISGGGNIKVSVAGTYTVIINDIDKFYYFIKQ